MNNYEKIKLALFAIDHNAYAIQSTNENLIAILDGKDDGFCKKCENRLYLLGKCLPKLAEVMEELGEIVNCMDAVSGLDAHLMKIPYDIIYGRMDADDYETEDI